MIPNVKPAYSGLFLLMTNRCNLICKHCCVWSRPKGHPGMEVSKALSVIDEMYSNFGPHKFTLSGGEPLTRPIDAIKILEHSLALKNNTMLLTNGMLITKRVADKLSSLKKLRIRISLDGSSEKNHDFMRGEGTFEKTIIGINNLRSSGYDLSLLELGCTITPGNEHEMEDILDFAKNKGIQIVILKVLSKLGRALDFWPNIPIKSPDIDTIVYRNKLSKGLDIKRSKDWYFVDLDETSFKEINVYYDGSVYSYSFMGDKDQKNAYIGSIYEESLTKILQSEKLSKSVTTKFLRYATGPARSLRSVTVFRK